jgi:hypothetical protein
METKNIIMATESELETNTSEFFKRYWPKDMGPSPRWSTHWDLNTEIPNQSMRGCYALLNQNSEIVYVGVGIGRSTEQYHGSGLGDRLKRYWELNNDINTNDRYKIREEWKERKVTSLIAIGFPAEHYWLAAALEVYLISNLTGLVNKVHNKEP